jgi:hypothetical protein
MFLIQQLINLQKKKKRIIHFKEKKDEKMVEMKKESII